MIKSRRFKTDDIYNLIWILKADCVEFIDGCLLDNGLYIFFTGEHIGYIAFYEEYETPNSSCYYVEISSTEEENLIVHNRFYKRFEKELMED